MSTKKEPTTNRALRHLRNHPGQVLHYTDIATAVGIESPQKVSTALARAALQHPEYGIVRVGAGQYQFLPHKQGSRDAVPVDDSVVRAGDMFECVGTTKTGVILIRGTKTDTIYKLSDEV